MKFNILFSLFALLVSLVTYLSIPPVEKVNVTEVTKITEIPYDILNQPQTAIVSMVGPIEAVYASYVVKIDGKAHKASISYSTLSEIKADVGDTVSVEWSRKLGMLKIFAGARKN